MFLSSKNLAVSGSAGQVIGRPGGHRHDRQRRVGAALGGEHAAIGDVQVGYREAAAVSVDDPVTLVGGHPGAADEVGVALDRDDLVRARRVQDVLHDGLRCLDQGPVVVARAALSCALPSCWRAPSAEPSYYAPQKPGSVTDYPVRARQTRVKGPWWGLGAVACRC